MSYQTYPGSGIAIAGLNVGGQCAAPGNAEVRTLASIPPPSLEDRLQRLQQGCERLQKLRHMVGLLADRISPTVQQAAQTDGKIRPEPTALLDRYSDAINYVHDSCDELEQLAHRLDELLFSGNRVERAR